jgi:aminobenzoyl-glutamate utilization protein B
MFSLSALALTACLGCGPAAAADVDALKQEAVKRVGEMGKLTQEMVDSIFSFSEPGFEESETSRYVTKILEENGFTIERGVAGMPTAWVRKYGSGKPVIALGSDVDCLPSMSQKPGVAFRSQLVDGAPGHGEGHNTGIPLQVTAAIAVKEIMQREKIPGTLVIWPGIAEELLAGKAYMVRAGRVQGHGRRALRPCRGRDVGAVGPDELVGLDLHGVQLQGPHGARRERALGGAERAGRRRAHERRLELSPRAPAPAAALALRDHQGRRPAEHRAGGGLRLVLPARARLRSHHWHEGTAIKIANAAAMMTDTTMTYRTLGSAWPQHMNKPIAEAVAANINAVGHAVLGREGSGDGEGGAGDPGQEAGGHG